MTEYCPLIGVQYPVRRGQQLNTQFTRPGSRDYMVQRSPKTSSVAIHGRHHGSFHPPGADHRIKTNIEQLISTDQHIFSSTEEAWQHLCPSNYCKIKQSRSIFTDQRFLIPVANDSMGDK